MFDVDKLMNEDVSGSMSTAVKPIPEGTYTAVISEVKLREVKTKNGVSLSLDVKLSLDAPELKEELKRDPTVFQSFWLDLDDNGRLDLSEGRNVKLGRLREAVGQNTPGQPWNIRKLEGQVVKVQTTNSLSEDGSQVYTNVKAFAKA